MKNNEISPRNYNNLLDRIAEVLAKARTKVVKEINMAQVLAYWEIGREIVEFEQKGKARGGYGEQLIERLSTDMTQEFGGGFSIKTFQFVRHCLTNPSRNKNPKRCLVNPQFNRHCLLNLKNSRC